MGERQVRERVTGPVTAVALSRLREWPENPRTINEERFAALQGSMLDDPAMLWARPLIALPDGTVIAGNMRLRAGRELGWTTIPTIYVELDADEARLWALRDNNQYGEWDEPALAELLADLAGRGLEVALAGFADRDLDRILAHLEPPQDPDDAPEPPATPRSQPGRIYKLGPHRLLCGDTTDPGKLARLIGSDQVASVWTDPPYGVDYVGKTPKRLRITNDNQAAGKLLEHALSAAARFLTENAPFYICAPGGSQGTHFRLALEGTGMRLHQTLVWVKNSPVLGRCDHQLQHEEILYGWAPGSGHPGRSRRSSSRWQGPNNVSSVFFVDRPARSEVHPTMKPVALITAQLANSTRRGDAVLDLFAGSGSTVIACEQLGRRCLAVEIDPAYCDVIRERYTEYTRGQT